MDFTQLTSDNWLLYATKAYDNPQCHSVEEFNEDLRRFSSIKRLLLRLSRKDENVNTRMLLNHIITVNNLFGIEAAPRLLFFYCDSQTHPYLKSFLLFLNSIPKTFNDFDLSLVPADSRIINKLNDI